MGDLIAPGSDRTARLVVPWLCCGASIGFLLWVIFSGTGELHSVPVGFRRYMFFFPVGLAVSGVAGVLLWFAGAWAVTGRLSYLSCVFYFGFLKVLGWTFVPWILLIVASIEFVRTREIQVETRLSLLLLHVMGSLAGLYMAFNMGRFLQPWGSFQEVVRSLWLLVSG
ncbi:MAG TPA: hypothetical protein QF499_09640 [Gammaproteobacteria bacterium]|nr:hypothetical protein [Chromatiales bacterium]MCP4926937.1 hypothetical protein [Gammaproteobacteria bacterium]MDP7154110.1 hypothetical protein [Gammaproteobacteria bacterium]HJP39374.1 hypothetical protein [Gammaproteobacteria bacterium]